MPLDLQAITFAEAARFVTANHRHHTAPRGWKFGVAVHNGQQIVGVAMAGRPVARRLDDGATLEITRCCVLPDHPNACSRLYGAIARAASALGYRRVITYTLASEPGVSLSAAGFAHAGRTKGGAWSRPSRPRTDQHPTEPKTLWEKR